MGSLIVKRLSSRWDKAGQNRPPRSNYEQDANNSWHIIRLFLSSFFSLIGILPMNILFTAYSKAFLFKSWFSCIKFIQKARFSSLNCRNSLPYQAWVLSDLNFSILSIACYNIFNATCQQHRGRVG